MWIKVVASGILFSKLFTFLFNLLNFLFLTTTLFTASLIFFKSTGTVFNLKPKSKASNFVFKLFKPVGTLTSLLMSGLWTSDFKAIKSILVAKLDVSTLVVSFNSF